MKKSWFLISLFVLTLFLNSRENKEIFQTIQKNIKTGKIIYSLTESEEIIKILGNPIRIKEKDDGGMKVMFMYYRDVEVVFVKRRKNLKQPYTLRQIKYKQNSVDIGRGKTIILRNKRDLIKIDAFKGFSNISLTKLDLRLEEDRLLKTRFDTLTVWPLEKRMPERFNPQQLINTGKIRGLGIGDLHRSGLKGQGVGIAIIDQPLLLGHQEYQSKIVYYDAVGMEGFPPQMHGSPVASIAVGKNLGVAPGSSLYYFAVPMWEKDNTPYIRAFKRILELNNDPGIKQKIRVISISTAGFQGNKKAGEFKDLTIKLEQEGVLLLTCEYNRLKFGTAQRITNTDFNNPMNFIKGKYASEKDNLRVPTGNLTYASHLGSNVYSFYPDGGRSWAAPYLAGLSAIAFQIAPAIQPSKIIDLLTSTSSKTKGGPLVNPKGFIEEVKKAISPSLAQKK